MLLKNIEFFSVDSVVYYKLSDESIHKLTINDTEVIGEMVELLENLYPEAYEALCQEYKGCSPNRWYYRYRIVSRFIRCNFAQLDDVPDISDKHGCKFEYVQCPLKGECKLEHIVCHPKIDKKISRAEMPVLKLWYEGVAEDKIAESLCLSVHTVHNHIRNAYQRIGVHSRAEFAKYVAINNIFV